MIYMVFSLCVTSIDPKKYFTKFKYNFSFRRRKKHKLHRCQQETLNHLMSIGYRKNHTVTKKRFKQMFNHYLDCRLFRQKACSCKTNKLCNITIYKYLSQLRQGTQKE